MSMNIVPHSLLVEVNAPLELEAKVRRIAKQIFKGPYNQQILQDLIRGLMIAHERQFGRSPLTAWRIVTEWNDMYAALQLRNVLTDETVTTTRLRSWEATASLHA